VGHNNWRRRELGYPRPWADEPGRSHLVTADRLRVAVQSAGFAIEQWNDLTEQAATVMQAVLGQPANAVGWHAFVTDFARKAENPTRALADRRLRAIQGIAQTDEPAP
jgi:sarcosine/dimethylglycine N-methyltransferase